MKHLTIILLLLAVSLQSAVWGENPNTGKKGAILMVHFGTTNDKARSTNIDALNKTVAEAFPEYDVTEAYTSRIVTERLRKRGIEKIYPSDALEILIHNGYDSIIVQPSHLLPGAEYEALKEELSAAFGELPKFGLPLMYSFEDTENLGKILASRHGDDEEGVAVVLIGHGSETPSNALYSQIEHQLHSGGHKNFFVATIEGYPDLDTLIGELKSNGVRKAKLVPLMLTAGEHFHNDINNEWKVRLEAEGIGVTTIEEGLGEIPEVREMYVENIMKVLDGETKTSSEKKRIFIRENL